MRDSLLSAALFRENIASCRSKDVHDTLLWSPNQFLMINFLQLNSQWFEVPAIGNTQVTGLFRSLTCVWAAVIVLDLTLISESVCVCGSEWGRRNVRERVVEWVSLCVWGLSAVRTVSVDEILTCTCDFSVCGSSSLEWLLLYTLSYHYMCQH